MRQDTSSIYYYAGGDEFNGSSVDVQMWDFSGWTRTIYSNREQQYYTDGANHMVNEGTLKLYAQRDTLTRRTIDALPDHDSLFVNEQFYSLNKRKFAFTSGQLISVESFEMGYFECRFRLSGARGYWPAFWLYSGDPTEEIDIMESKTERASSIHIDTHCEKKCDLVQGVFRSKSFGGWVKTKIKFNEGFNVVSCLWMNGKIRFYVNWHCIGVSRVMFTRPKKLIVNLAVPSNNGPFKPGPKQSDTSGAVFEVDYIRFFSPDHHKRKTVQFAPMHDLKHEDQSAIVKSKSRYVYGKKADHLDNGYFVVVSQSNKLVYVQLLEDKGREIIRYSLLSRDGQDLLQSGHLSSAEPAIIGGLRSGEYLLMIEGSEKRLTWPVLVE